jgi:hypothetical protein
LIVPLNNLLGKLPAHFSVSFENAATIKKETHDLRGRLRRNAGRVSNGVHGLEGPGFVLPAEIEMMKTLADKRARLFTIDASSSEALALKREISDLQLKVSVRLEHIARGS